MILVPNAYTYIFGEKVSIAVDISAIEAEVIVWPPRPHCAVATTGINESSALARPSTPRTELVNSLELFHYQKLQQLLYYLLYSVLIGCPHRIFKNDNINF